MNKLKKITNDLTEIFQEAHVIDLDFSVWDDFVRMVVIGQMMELDVYNRSPVFNVDFVNVHSISWQSRHLRIKPLSGGHCQWTLFDVDVVNEDNLFQVHFPGMSPEPDFYIVCEDIEISQVDSKIIDSINPNWTKAGASFCRPSLERLYKIHEK